MRGRNLKPSRVHQIATHLLEAGGRYQEPPWYKTIGSIPPSEILTRTQAPQHKEPVFKSKARKPSKVFRPLPIDYEEDVLRKQFFSDHPWELARPRIVLEDDGLDGQRVDWSRIQQKGRPLNGERYEYTAGFHCRSNEVAVWFNDNFGL
jgi:small subunit ribosomal protein S23